MWERLSDDMYVIGKTFKLHHMIHLRVNNIQGDIGEMQWVNIS